LCGSWIGLDEVLFGEMSERGQSTSPTFPSSPTPSDEPFLSLPFSGTQPNLAQQPTLRANEADQKETLQVWFLHKRVCGAKAVPFRWPGLTKTELEDMENISKRDHKDRLRHKKEAKMNRKGLIPNYESIRKVSQSFSTCREPRLISPCYAE